MAGAGLVGEAPCAGKILRRTAVQRWLDRFPVMGGKGVSATGWGYKHRQAQPGDTAFAALALCDGQTAGDAGNIGNN